MNGFAIWQDPTTGLWHPYSRPGWIRGWANMAPGFRSRRNFEGYGSTYVTREGEWSPGWTLTEALKMQLAIPEVR